LKNCAVNSNKITLVPNPADISSFHVRKETSHGVFKFISIALFRTEKRLDLLIRAFARVHQKHKDVCLTIVGDGPEKNNLISIVKKLEIGNFIEFKGYLSKKEIALLLPKCNTLILNSDVETFGVALVEALASGIPVIATRCGGPSDIVTPETGYLINKGNVEELYQSMLKMIGNYKSFNAEIIREIAVRKYGDKAYAKSIFDLCTNI
jgi:glycosyltransferase involved in cell wall biosynthesis